MNKFLACLTRIAQQWTFVGALRVCGLAWRALYHDILNLKKSLPS